VKAHVRASAASAGFVQALDAVVKASPLVSEAVLIRRATHRFASTVSVPTLVEYAPVVEYVKALRARPERAAVYVDDPTQVHDYVLHLFREVFGFKCRNVVDNTFVRVHPSFHCTADCQHARSVSADRPAKVAVRRCVPCGIVQPLEVCEYCGDATTVDAPVPALPAPRPLPWSDYQFELVVALFLALVGLESVTVSAPGPDGGIDVAAVRPAPSGDQLVAVQVKGHVTPGPEPLRAFVTASAGCDVSVFVSRAVPTASMVQEAELHDVVLLGPAQLGFLVDELGGLSVGELAARCRSVGVQLEADLVRRR
jgi:hypothetical protein